MARNPRYDVLFEPVRIGPVTAKNRFYQVPHCSGMGFHMPQMLAAMREVKAEGGWGVVCTEYCSIHPTADDSPFPYASLWDEDDVRCQAVMAEKVHAHGALAGVELWHGGNHATNRTSRLPSMSPSGHQLQAIHPAQTRAMDLQDIRDLRRWQVDAAKRAKRAGFDIVYVYAGHGYLPFQFIARRLNQRSDEYGGRLENRVRFLREMIEDTKEAVGDTCAVAVRFAVDELMGADGITSDGEGREVIEMLAELPDLWDVNLSYVENDSWSARFSDEAYQEPFVAFVKQVTSKPVVGVGRFTSPDTMAGQIRRGVLDLIGAARPSIADPFLPAKIADGREDEIRECIGCNMCRAANNEDVPIRCTQNPTMGEEWRRGWHPEIVPAKGSESRVLVVGAGPAGLECAVTLGKRGYGVVLAEGSTRLGGRVSRESLLPGLAAWARVRDYRQGQIQRLANVEVYLHSRLDAEQVLEFGFDHVILATGATWRRDGMGYFNRAPLPVEGHGNVLTPDDVLDGGRASASGAIQGPVVIYDEDHYYMGGALAEKLARDGLQVTLVTPATEVSTWSKMTDEQFRVQKRLLELGVTLVLTRKLSGVEPGAIEVACIYSDRRTRIAAQTLVVVGARQPNDALYHEMMRDPAAIGAAGIRSVQRIGDCFAPAAIIHAVYSGHRMARELDAAPPGEVPYRRERVVVV